MRRPVNQTDRHYQLRLVNFDLGYLAAEADEVLFLIGKLLLGLGSGGMKGCNPREKDLVHSL